MGVSELRYLQSKSENKAFSGDSFGEELVRSGAVSESDLRLAKIVGRHCDTTIDRILSAEGLATENELLTAHARRLKSRQLSAQEVSSAKMIDADIDPRLMLRHSFIVLRDEYDRPLVVTSDMERLREITPELPIAIAGAQRALAPRQAILDRIADQHRGRLVEYATSRVPSAESFRVWGRFRHRRMWLAIGSMAILSALTVFEPTITLSVLVIWAVVTLIVATTLKTAAYIASFSTSPSERKDLRKHLSEPLPKVSILVPLFREDEILHALIARLTQLTYPKCLLDVILVLEEEDELTRETLAKIDLPNWIKPVLVPHGSPKTKPRAMNYALDFCEGDIVGILDAEDAPEPDQITVIAREFQAAPDDVACLQGILDYYNPKQNWLARCFTIEYATWFRRILPGMARLGFAIPLGGTTLFFRRDLLEKLGGWDAHNVTEDADLGFRLSRHGYRTEMVHTVTEEEANCLFWPWIKQRSRWLKGYLTTYIVHMRKPFLLYKQLGLWKFLGFQAHFVSALSQFILAPVLWSFWLVIFGFSHPMISVLPPEVLVVGGSVFLMTEIMNIIIHITAVSGRKHEHLMLWVPTMYLYSSLGAIAAYKALYELIFKPFYWDKTTHGLSLDIVDVPDLVERSNGTGHFSAVELQSRHERL